MSALPDAPGHFADWLKARAEGQDGSFATRRTYGLYLCDLLEEAAAANPGRGWRWSRPRRSTFGCRTTGRWSVSRTGRRLMRTLRWLRWAICRRTPRPPLPASPMPPPTPTIPGQLGWRMGWSGTMKCCSSAAG
ncbi:MAG: FAD/NAD(P)-binding protein [Sphingobium sp.]